MTRLKKFLICVVATGAMLVPAAPHAAADHAPCPKVHDVPNVATGSVSSTQQLDWWTHETVIPYTTYTMTMSGGDADLIVYAPDGNGCERIACSSGAFGSATDQCRALGVGTFHVLVKWYDGNPNYTLNITKP